MHSLGLLPLSLSLSIRYHHFSAHAPWGNGNDGLLDIRLVVSRDGLSASLSLSLSLSLSDSLSLTLSVSLLQVSS